MRNPARLDGFYDELKRIHKQYFPDWRFGQLCSNFFGWLMSEKKRDLFFPEEDEMLDWIKEYSGEKSPRGLRAKTNIIDEEFWLAGDFFDDTDTIDEKFWKEGDFSE